MTRPSDAPEFLPFSVIGPQFITPNPLEVIVDQFSNGNLVITDINHKILLKVKPCDTRFHCQRVLLDANDKPIVTLREKNVSIHGRWNAFRGESKADSDMIFSIKAEHAMFQFKTNMNVKLANKMSNNNDRHLKMKGDWSKKNCKIYMGESSTTIAQMHTAQPAEKLKCCKDKFMVKIHPNIDYAFVVALFAIVDAVENPVDKLSFGGVAVAVIKVGGAVANS